MDTLPLEVLAIVVDKLAEDTTDDTTHKSLKACSLVSHSFLLCARAHLFKTVYLRKHKHRDIPITTAAASPPVSRSKLRRARAHLIDTALLRKYKNSAVPIPAAVSSPTLALVKSLTIDFSPFISKSHKPYPSFGSTVRFPTSLGAFTALENLTLMHLSWDPWTTDALLRHPMQTGPQIFQVLLLEAIQFPCTSDLCSIVRASSQLRILSCVGVYIQNGGGCSEQHVWDHIEILGLVILHVVFRMFVRGSMENDYRLLKAILDPEQCPKALPKLRWILFLVDALADTDLFDELLEMTEGTVTELTMFFPVVPATCPRNLHISHLLRLELFSWESTARHPTQDAIKTLQRIRGYLEQDLKYRLKRLEMQLSQCIVLPLGRISTSMEQALEAFFENLASSDRFGELEEVQLNFATDVGMKYVESRTWNSFESLRRNGVKVTMSLIPP